MFEVSLFASTPRSVLISLGLQRHDAIIFLSFPLVDVNHHSLAVDILDLETYEFWNSAGRSNTKS